MEARVEHVSRALICDKFGSKVSWWRHKMETFSALLAFCAGNSQVNGKFPAQRPVTRSFAVFFDLRLNQQLNKQWRRWWFETPSRSLWRHCNGKWMKQRQIFWEHRAVRHGKFTYLKTTKADRAPYIADTCLQDRYNNYSGFFIVPLCLPSFVTSCFQLRLRALM